MQPRPNATLHPAITRISVWPPGGRLGGQFDAAMSTGTICSGWRDSAKSNWRDRRDHPPKVEKKENTRSSNGMATKYRVRFLLDRFVLANAIASPACTRSRNCWRRTERAIARAARRNHPATAWRGTNGQHTAPKWQRRGQDDAPAPRPVAQLHHHGGRARVLAYWEQGRSRIPALGKPPSADAAERAKLIALATYAARPTSATTRPPRLRIDALADIPGFIRDLLAALEKQFGIEIDVKAGTSSRARAPSRSRPSADRRAGGGLNLRWIFRAGEKLLSEDRPRAAQAWPHRRCCCPSSASSR